MSIEQTGQGRRFRVGERVSFINRHRASGGRWHFNIVQASIAELRGDIVIVAHRGCRTALHHSKLLPAGRNALSCALAAAFARGTP